MRAKLSGREAAHLLRTISFARRRDLPLLPVTGATSDIEGAFFGKNLKRLFDGATEENLLDRIEAALARGQDAPAAGMFKALRKTGLPADGLFDLATWLSGRAAERHRFVRAVGYPFTLMITGALIYSIALHGYALPILIQSFKQLFDGLGANLPGLTRFYFWFYNVPDSMLSNRLTAILYVATTIGITILFTYLGLHFKDYRIALYLPFTGRYLRYEGARNFSETLALLLGFGVSLPEAVRIASQSASSASIRERLGGIAGRVASGASLGECLRNIETLPPTVAWRLWSAYYRSTFVDELHEVARSCSIELGVLEMRIIASSKTAISAIVLLILAPFFFAIIAMYLPMFTLISQL